ncbi:DUF6482 family protein [Shewanella sp. UCD-KL21]|uniref:DUF6482 family protein n=1 Tax=Shewanella sp. UCD-KL21 TaxID=1917164 RepID=UPI0009FB0493|nr:DUF6482 family protein [Shewanella sp. UCD-KL21]
MPNMNKVIHHPKAASQHGLNTFEQSVYNDSQPTIIGVADSTHYLVGLVDADNNFSGQTADKACAVVNSLAEAKTLLRSHYYSRANVVYQTAYDEMCGLAANGHYHESIKL